MLPVEGSFRASCKRQSLLCSDYGTYKRIFTSPQRAEIKILCYNIYYNGIMEIQFMKNDHALPKRADTLSRGIFWVLAESKDDIEEKNIFPVYVPCDTCGNPLDTSNLNSKSGKNYNHKATWATLPKSITNGKPFDYYPRGRVEIKDGKAIIWLNGSIIDLDEEIKYLFCLNTLKKIVIKVDGSEHYRCHFPENEAMHGQVRINNACFANQGDAWENTTTVGHFFPKTTSHGKIKPYWKIFVIDDGAPTLYVNILKANGNRKLVCVSLTNPARYMSTPFYPDTMTASEAKALDKFLRSAYSTPQTLSFRGIKFKIATYWEYCVYVWIRENNWGDFQGPLSGGGLSIDADKDNFVIYPKQPDYTILGKK